MAFFSDKRGDLRPIADIERIDPGVYWGDKSTHRPAKVYMKGGDEWGIEIDKWVLSQITEEAAPVIKANPGFETLTYWYHADEPDDPGEDAEHRRHADELEGLQPLAPGGPRHARTARRRRFAAEIPR